MTKINSAKTILIYCPLFMIFYNLTGNLSNDIYLPTLPILSEVFHTSHFLAQFTMTIWFLGVALPQIYFGLIADKFGRRPLMLWGGVLFIAATCCCLFATNIYSFLLGRFLQGVGVSSLNIATFATVQSHYYEEKTSIKLIAWINATGSLAPLIGPVIGSYLFHLWGWRSTFIVILILGVLAIIGLYFFMLETYDLQRSKEFKINLSSSWHFYKPVFANQKLWVPTIAYTCFLGGLIAYLTTAPFIIYKQFAVPIEYFGITQVVPFALFIAGGMTVNWAINGVKPQTLIYCGFVIMGVSFIDYAVMTVFDSYLTLSNYIGATGMFLYGFALCGSPLVAETLSSAANKGGTSAALGLSMAVMACLSSFLTALFYVDQFSSFSMIMCGFIFFGILSYLVLPSS